MAAMPSAWLRRNVRQPCDGGPLLRAIYLATLVCPIAMPSLSSSPWIRGEESRGEGAVFVPMARGFVYLVAVIDCFSREVLSLHDLALPVDI